MDITFLPYLHYLSFLICLGFIFYVLYKDYKSSLNIACALFLFCFALWDFGMIFIHNPNSKEIVVEFWYNLNSFGWISFSYFFFWFAIIYIDSKKILKFKFLYIFLFFIPLVLIYKKFGGELFDHYILMPYGWAHVWRNNFWTYLFYFYYTSFVLVPLFLLFQYWRKTKYEIKRKQTKIILISVSIALVLGSLFSVLLPELNNYYFPSIGDISSLIWVVGVVYAIKKYNFLMTPEAVARNIIDKMSDALIILDKKGNIMSINSAAAKILNYSEKELLNQSINYVYTDAKLKEKILDKASRGEVYTNESLMFKTRGYRKNVPVLFSNSLLKNINNDIAGIVCVSKDISDVRKIEKNLEIKNKELENNVRKLNKSKDKINNAIDKIDKEKRNIDLEKNKISSIISSFSDPIIVLDKYSSISYINSEAKNIFGFENNMVGKKYFLKDFSMNNLKVVAKVDFSVLKNNEFLSEDSDENIEEIVIHDKKKDLTYKVITVKMLEGKDYYGLIKIFHNLTKEKEMDKLKSEFISIAAHQLRTPLSAVKWVMKMILDGDAGSLTKEQSELLEKGYSNNERMINLVNDLLYVSRIEEGRFGYTLKLDDYLEVIKSLISENEKLCKEKNIKFEYEMPEKLPKLNIDRERIGLVLKNILSNSRKYTPENGKVKLIINREDDFVRTKIIDNGMGIPKEEEERLFEKFFRGTNAQRSQTSGSGLGLYITKNIIKKHGGEISIHSEEGKGTEVEFTLPIKKYKNFNI